MSRNVRDTVIIAKTETTYGVNAAGTGAANAILCSEPRITPLVAQNVDRALVRPYFGGSEQLVGTRYVRCEFEVELAGSGTAGTVPAWGPLLRACAFAEVATPGTRVDYTPITNAQESVTIDYFVAGARHRLLGARGNVKIGLASGDRPLMMFSFRHHRRHGLQEPGHRRPRPRQRGELHAPVGRRVGRCDRSRPGRRHQAGSDSG